MPQRFVRHPAYGYLPPGNHAVLLVKEIGQHCAVKLRGSCHARSVSARTDNSRRALPEHPEHPAQPQNQQPPKADEPRTDTHPRRTNPGPTPTQGGRTPDRPPWRSGTGNPATLPHRPSQPPPKADEPRTDTHPRRTNPGPTPTQGGRTPDRPPWRSGTGNPATLPHRPSQPPQWRTNPGPTPTQDGRTPDRHPPKADETRTDHHGGQEPGIRAPCPTAPANPPQWRTNPGPTPTQDGRNPDRPPCSRGRWGRHRRGWGVGTGGGG